MGFSDWFGTKKDPQVWKRYNRVLGIKLAKSIQRIEDEFNIYNNAKSDVVDQTYYYRTKFFMLDRIKKELSNSNILSWKVSDRNVPIKQLYATIYGAIYNKKRSGGYSYYDSLYRFVNGQSTGDLPSIEHELAAEMYAYREQILQDLKILPKHDVEDINKEINITKTLNPSNDKSHSRSFLPQLICGVILLGALMFSFAEKEGEESHGSSDTTRHAVDTVQIDSAQKAAQIKAHEAHAFLKKKN